MVKERLKFVDIARGIGMICIILGHLGNAQIDRVVYPFHVPLFFIIAGYFINEKRSIGDFIKSRVRSLLVPYAVTCLVMIVIGTIEGVILYGPVGIWQGLNWVWAAVYGSGNSIHIQFYIKEIGAIWFLLALFWGSVLFRISLRMKKLLRPLFVAALFVAAVLTRNVFWLPFSIQPGMCAVFFLYMGHLVSRFKEPLLKTPITVKIIGAVMAAAGWAVFIIIFKNFWFVRCWFGNIFPEILLCLCACGAVIAISWVIGKIPYISSGLSLVGRYSLMILCVHNIELNFFPWRYAAGILVAAGMPAWMELPLIIAGKIIADLFFAWLLLKAEPVRKLFGYKS